MKTNEFSITFLTPPKDKKGDIRDLRDDILDNYGLNSIIATLNDNGYDVDYFNADLLNLSCEQVVKILLYKEKPSLLGISVLENNIEITCKLIHELAKNDYTPKIVVGGFFPTLNYEEIMQECPEIDFCILGEGEISMLELVKSLENNNPIHDISGLVYREDNDIKVVPQQEINLNELPAAAKTHMPYLFERGGSAYVVTSRGCYSNCTFCSIKAFYNYIKDKAWRQIEIKKIVDEIELLATKWDHRIIPIWDDNIISGKSGKTRAYEFIDEIKKRNLHVKFFINCRVDDVDKDLFIKLKEIGLARVGLGIENLVPEHLKFYGKGINVDKIKNAVNILDELEIKSYLTFILFNPFTKFDDIRVNLDFFLNRLEKESGSSFGNLLLPSVSILGLSVGSSILSHPVIKEIAVKKGFHYDYNIIDKEVELFKRLVFYMSTQWWPVYITLVHLEYYIFNPFYEPLAKSVPAETISEYNSIWHDLAKLHLLSYKNILDNLSDNNLNCESILSGFITELNQLIQRLKSFISDNKFDNSFMKIQHYTFKKDNDWVLFDITKSEFFIITELDNKVIQKYNLLDEKQIINSLLNEYDNSSITASLEKIRTLISNGNLVYSNYQLTEISENQFKRTAQIILKSKN